MIRPLARRGSPSAALAQPSTTADPGGAALAAAQALLERGDVAGAAGALDALLLAFAADAWPGLADLAGAVCQAPEGPPGWVGLAGDGAVVGALAPADRLALDLAPDVAAGEGACDTLPRFRAPMGRAARRALAGALPEGVLGARSLDAPPGWRLAGWVRRRGALIFGSATMGWAPGAPVTVVLTDPAGDARRVTTAPSPAGAGVTRHDFAIRLGPAQSPGGLTIEALTPDGDRVALWGSPLRAPGGRAQARRWGRASRPPAQTPAPPARVSIIVPDLAGRRETLACLEAVLETAPPDIAEVIVVGGAAGEADPALGALIEAGRVTRLAAPADLDLDPGQDLAVGLALAHRPDNDIILLSPAARVHGDWLARLRAAAHAAPDIATAAPVSNQGALLTWPAGGEGEVDAATGARVAALLAALHPGQIMPLPAAAGGCLYIRRDALSRIGANASVDDLRRHAVAAGWRHVGAADVFVSQAPGAFGLRDRLAQAFQWDLLFRRHPGRRRAMARFVADDPFAATRRALGLRLGQGTITSPAPPADSAPLARIGLRARNQAPADFDGRDWARPPLDGDADADGGGAGEGAWVEAFRIGLAGPAPGDVQYRALLAGGAETPWTPAPAWCGDPAGARPVIGVAVRLVGDLAGAWRPRTAAMFSSGWVAADDGKDQDDDPARAPLRSPWPNDPLVALRLTLTPRGPAPKDQA